MEDKAFVDALGSYITNYRKSFHPTMSAREFAGKCEISRMVINDLDCKRRIHGNKNFKNTCKYSKQQTAVDRLQCKAFTENHKAHYKQYNIKKN